ncbi:Uncharacterised protein r2_g2781 [Pycnogonum litorale]
MDNEGNHDELDNNNEKTAGISRCGVFGSCISYLGFLHVSADPNRPESKCAKCGKIFPGSIGISLAFSASFMASLSAVLIRVVSFSLNPAEIFAIRSIAQFTLMIPFMIVSRKEITLTKIDFALLSVMSVLDTAGSLSTHYAFSLIPVPEASVIINCRHIFTLPIAKYWLKEHVGIYEVVVVAISIAGLVVICQPPALFGGAAIAFTTARMLGLICSTTSAAFNATSKCITRKLRHVNLYLILFLPSVVSSITGIAITFGWNEYQNPIQVKDSYFVLVIVGVCIGSNTCQSAATQRSMAVTVAIIMTLRLPFTILLEFLIIGDLPNSLSMIGFGLSVMAILVLSIKIPLYKKLDWKRTDEESTLLG